MFLQLWHSHPNFLWTTQGVARASPLSNRERRSEISFLTFLTLFNPILKASWVHSGNGSKLADPAHRPDWTQLWSWRFTTSFQTLLWYPSRFATRQLQKFCSTKWILTLTASAHRCLIPLPRPINSGHSTAQAFAGERIMSSKSRRLSPRKIRWAHLWKWKVTWDELVAAFPLLLSGREPLVKQLATSKLSLLCYPFLFARKRAARLTQSSD